MATSHPTDVGSTTSGPERPRARFTGENGTELMCAAVFFEFATTVCVYSSSDSLRRQLITHYVSSWTAPVLNLHKRSSEGGFLRDH